jgi:lipid-binding SYLF domain-containing protein
MINGKHLFIASTLAVFALIFSAAAPGEDTRELDRSAAHTLERFNAESTMRRELAQKASGILIFPRLAKAGAGLGAEYGRGVLQVAGKTVAHYALSGASLGATLGASEHSEVVLFMTPDALQRFLATEVWTVGADAQVAVVTKGVGGTYDTETLQKPILGFVFDERGLMADVSLEGTKITRKPS